MAGLLAVACQERNSGVDEAPSTPEGTPAEAVPALVDLAAEHATEPGTAAAELAVQRAQAPSEPDGPRVYAKTRFIWIRPEPDGRKQWIGFLWTGGSVRLRSSTPVAGPGCATFYAIEPQGFVCVDGERATLDPNDPAYQALRPYALKADSPWPHRYGESIGLSRYFSSPTPEHQRQRERDLTSHLHDLSSAREGSVPARLEKVDLSLPAQLGFDFPELPRTIFEDRKHLKARSTVAFSTEARFGDRGFLLSADYAWVPKDRVIPYPTIEFRGLSLDKDKRLPLAFFRRNARPKYVRVEDGAFQASEHAFERLSHVELTGARERWNGDHFYQTRDNGFWLKEQDAVIPEPRSKTPWGATLNEEDTTGRAKGRGTWIQISIERGWLIAYEGTRPVYVTLMSPGRGGAAAPDAEPLETSATPTGVWPISGKLVTATMVAPGELVHSDVPFAQNIVGPYALHGAYWHDNFGNRQSGGCINLSPIDAKWMFDFTDPPVPEGWHAVRWLPWQGPATTVILQR